MFLTSYPAIAAALAMNQDVFLKRWTQSCSLCLRLLSLNNWFHSADWVTQNLREEQKCVFFAANCACVQVQGTWQPGVNWQHTDPAL